MLAPQILPRCPQQRPSHSSTDPADSAVSIGELCLCLSSLVSSPLCKPSLATLHRLSVGECVDQLCSNTYSAVVAANSEMSFVT